MRGPAGPAGAREQRRAREQSAARRQGMPAPPGPAPLFYDQILAAAARVERELAADEGSAEGDGDGEGDEEGDGEGDGGVDSGEGQGGVRAPQGWMGRDLSEGRGLGAGTAPRLRRRRPAPWLGAASVRSA